MDRILDAAKHGPSYLGRPEIAQIVLDALLKGATDLRRFDLHAYVIMPNHVHLLVTPNVDASKWLGPLKGVTAHAANKILNTPGQPFWQEESYDHLVRSPEEFERIQRYIENKAGLTASPESFRWSNAFRAG